jgi:hypothetical protein
MIYLIDDNQNNQMTSAYGLSFVKEGLFSDYLKHIDKIEKKDGADEIEHLSFLKNADCLLVHSTTEDINSNGEFIKGSNSNVIKIKESISGEGGNIPLVLFSNKMDEVAIYNHDLNQHYIVAIKKNKFYERLYDFIRLYKDTKDVELRIIAYGKNFISEEISKYAKELLMHVAFEKGSEILKITHISSLNTFRQFISKVESKNTFTEIITSIEDNPMTIEEYREKINSIVQSLKNYGKNIYNWQ